MRCVWKVTQEPNGSWKHVSHCGEVRFTPPEFPRIERDCRTGGCIPYLDPSLPTKAYNFGSALLRWVAAGRPKRSDEEVARIYDTICAACPHYRAAKTGDAGHCKKCGCALSRAGGLRNKILMETEHCPIGLW